MMSKYKREFLHKQKENNREHKSNKPSNNDDIPCSFPMLREDCNVITLELASNNDDAVLSPQQCNIINVPSLPPIKHEECTEITENSSKRIPDLCTCIVDKILSYKEFILIKEK